MPEENKAETLSSEMMGATRSAETARALIRKTKRATRRRFPTEEKIRVVMEGVRGEVSMAELCRREGIHPTIYYKWLRISWRRAKRACAATPCAKPPVKK
jgi:transposase